MSPNQAEPTTRPNILFFMTDDQTVQDMSCYGNTILSTPNMDRLAREGTRFTNAFCTSPRYHTHRLLFTRSRHFRKL